MQREGKLYNHLDRVRLEQRLKKEEFSRRTLSFYSFSSIENTGQWRDDLFKKLNELGALGRIYLATEGINAQISVPEHRLTALKAYFKTVPFLRDIALKYAIEEASPSFSKLVIKVKGKILADGLDKLDLSKAGEHLSPEDFHAKLADEGVIVLDVRNHYESELGHFQNALCPDVKTFRESLPIIREQLRGKEKKEILMYCTGGIRCEKASAYLKERGFDKVKQLEGGIIHYVQKMRQLKKKSKFEGSNFVFDDRLIERVDSKVLSSCHQCGSKSNRVVNCKNEICHLLFIQCDSCGAIYNDTCGDECKKMIELPKEEYEALKKKYNKLDPFISRLARSGKGKR